jgi:CO/xanthine dehydrogenase Mo-binding subunit
MSFNEGVSGSRQRGPFIGRPMPRFEDLRLVRGAGNYTDDVSVPEQAYAVFVRTPHAHARVVSIDVSAARARPGVLAVPRRSPYGRRPHRYGAHAQSADAHDVKIPTSSRRRSGKLE